MEIVKKYKPEEAAEFPRMFAGLVMCFDENVTTGSLGDELGSLFMMLELGNDRTGQFFTPFEVSKLMARLLVADGADVRDRGFLRLSEPACGSGGMVIAYADALREIGINYQRGMHAVCVDVDIRCVHMTYLQLSLLHIPAIVVHGNSLSLEKWSQWYTPAHVMSGWRQRLLAGHAQPQDVKADMPAPATVTDGTAPVDVPKAVYMDRLVQLALF